jgi:hypothetical protein
MRQRNLGGEGSFSSRHGEPYAALISDSRAGAAHVDGVGFDLTSSGLVVDGRA